MKNISNRLISFLLASIILFTSSGFGLVEHSCSMRGNKTYSFVNKDACKSCGKDNSKSANKTSISPNKCCESKKVESNENISQSIVNIESKFVKNTSEFVANSIFFLFYKATEIVLNVNNSPQKKINSHFGKSLLHFISLLRL